MRQRSILQFGCLISSCTIAFASPAIAQSSAPVIRANGFTKQVPSCYIETTNSGLQNLDATCLMGKAPNPKLLDMVTDRDNDGVPDDLAAFFKRMNDGVQTPNGTPAGAEAQANLMKKLFQELAQRAPVSPATRKNLNELADAAAFLTIGGSQSGARRNLSPAEQAQLTKRFERFSQISQQLEKDPFVQKMNEYSRRYYANRPRR